MVVAQPPLNQMMLCPETIVVMGFIPLIVNRSVIIILLLTY